MAVSTYFVWNYRSRAISSMALYAEIHSVHDFVGISNNNIVNHSFEASCLLVLCNVWNKFLDFTKFLRWLFYFREFLTYLWGQKMVKWNIQHHWKIDGIINFCVLWISCLHWLFMDLWKHLNHKNFIWWFTRLGSE